ncbi:MAG: hypothetical protein SWO11_21785 [Thermodesulfobacteriota bacterium]|nr:hypothetical protein [Thermodesulfobacteriota bacterium]
MQPLKKSLPVLVISLILVFGIIAIKANAASGGDNKSSIILFGSNNFKKKVTKITVQPAKEMRIDLIGCNNAVQSIKVGKNFSYIRLYADFGCKGNYLEIAGGEKRKSLGSFNKLTSSIHIQPSK